MLLILQIGSQNIYRYEDFTNATPSFNLISEINPNPTVYFIPQNYRGQTGDSLEDCACLSGYPTLSYENDVFNSWLAQNSNIINIEKQSKLYNLNMNYASQAIGYMGDALTGVLSAINPLELSGVRIFYCFYGKSCCRS